MVRGCARVTREAGTHGVVAADHGDVEQQGLLSGKAAMVLEFTHRGASSAHRCRVSCASSTIDWCATAWAILLGTRRCGPIAYFDSDILHVSCFERLAGGGLRHRPKGYPIICKPRFHGVLISSGCLQLLGGYGFSCELFPLQRWIKQSNIA